MTTLMRIGQLLAEIKTAYKMQDRIRAMLLCDTLKEILQQEQKQRGGVLFSNPQNPINRSANTSTK
jgi:hypothetical protein